MNSVWQETIQLPQFKKLKEDIESDVLIIGGGMAGILCAYALEKEGIKYTLVEAERICSGITKHTTAKITSQHGLIYDKLTKKFGPVYTRMYLEANQEALEKYRSICENMDCDFKNEDAYVYSMDRADKIEKEVKALKEIGFDADFCESIPLPFEVAGAVRFKNQAHFNPLKFVAEISKNLNIYEHTKVLELKGMTAVTEGGTIKAKKFIVATHFPFLNKHGSYFIKMYQHRSYVIALENAQNVNGMYVDESKTGMSFRNYKDLLLIGGGGHRTGKQGGCYQELEAFAKRHYKNAQIKYRWATQDCMTLDGVPYIGPYSASTTDLYVATGFNKWGMTTSMVSAMILVDMIKGGKNKYADIFNPSRSILQPQLPVNAFEAVVNLATPTKKRCPHLGCALKWNAEEHSWDCPCHGSRFTNEGELIDNPATGNMKM